jgi:hypothetical protein
MVDVTFHYQKVIFVRGGSERVEITLRFLIERIAEY